MLGRRQSPVAVPSAKVVAGKYDGFIRLGFQSGDYISSPITLTVRDAPLIAIMLLALGIVFGRALQAVNSPTAQAQQRLLTNLAALRGAAGTIDDQIWSSPKENGGCPSGDRRDDGG